MLLQFENLTIRNATVEDAELLATWWNDGKIMAHAGFPNGTGETEESIASRIIQDRDDIHRRLIIELDNVPIGEMNYCNVGDKTAELGIKICDFSKQDKGYGKILLSMLLGELFNNMGYEKAILDTNFKNVRAQHVYEQLGFKKVQIRENSWYNQLGEVQSSIDYELGSSEFVNFAK